MNSTGIGLIRGATSVGDSGISSGSHPTDEIRVPRARSATSRPSRVSIAQCTRRIGEVSR
jgi:hypothetical protein